MCVYLRDVLLGGAGLVCNVCSKRARLEQCMSLCRFASFEWFPLETRNEPIYFMCKIIFSIYRAFGELLRPSISWWKWSLFEYPANTYRCLYLEWITKTNKRTLVMAKWNRLLGRCAKQWQWQRHWQQVKFIDFINIGSDTHFAQLLDHRHIVNAMCVCVLKVWWLLCGAFSMYCRCDFERKINKYTHVERTLCTAVCSAALHCVHALIKIN